MSAIHVERNVQYEERIYIKTSGAVTAGHRGLEDGRIYKLVLTGLLVALSYVVFILLQTKVIPPGDDITLVHLGNAVCVPGALILGGFYGGLGGALGMTIGDLFDPIHVVYAPKAFLLKLCIGLIIGLVAHKIGRVNESPDKGHMFRFAVAASVCGLLSNVIFDSLVGYYYKLAILGKPTAELVLAWNTISTSISAVTSVAATVVVYMPLRSTLIRAGLFDRLR